MQDSYVQFHDCLPWWRAAHASLGACMQPETLRQLFDTWHGLKRPALETVQIDFAVILKHYVLWLLL
jgi:hypothetical protein